jgi:class 3 adenylate cyclase
VASEAIDLLGTARQASQQFAWRKSYEAYSELPASELTASDLEAFADAAWWNGRLEQAINLREDAYAGYLAAGENRAAARIALLLVSDQLGLAAYAVAGGWFANAERLLEGEAEAPEHAHLAVMRASFALYMQGDPQLAISEFDRAFELGERLGDRNTQVLARVGKGRALVKSGDVDAGLALLDEATAVCGELPPFFTGMIYCMTISSCHDLGDYRRAAEWTDVANRWCDSLDVTGFPGACRIHRAEIMRLRGEWPQAEAQALAACSELGDFERSITANGYYEIGEIRRLRGDFAGAEEAFRTADELGRAPQPGLSLLRVAEGKVEAAVAGLRRVLGDVSDPLVRMRSLPAQVEVSLEAGDLKAARGARDELDGIAESFKMGGRRAAAFDAAVDLASGEISLAENDAEEAAAFFRRAREHWQEVGAPYETARARMLLGTAFRRQGDEHSATSELEAALATFDRLGATVDADRTKELLGRQQARRTFMFTDIVDSTRLMATLGNEKWRKLLARHNELLRGRIVERGGEVVQQTGDGFFAAFVDARAAIEAAIEIQRALDAEIVAPDVRIGAHAGGTFESDGEFNRYGGDTVHLAARIGAAAGACEILVSRETLDGMSERFRLSEPRAETFKGFEEPVEVVQVSWR